jgi:hypothetical protein
VAPEKLSLLNEKPKHNRRFSAGKTQGLDAILIVTVSLSKLPQKH